MRRPIIVAVDGSEASLQAAEWAACEAARRTAPLRIVSAPGPLPRMRTYHASPVDRGERAARHRRARPGRAP